MSTLGDILAIACAEAFRGDGKKMVSPMAPVPRLGARLAQASFSPDIVLTDGVATIVDLDGNPEGWMPFSRVFDTLWNGQRHVMMGASQLDRFGNQNISALGDWQQPKVQLLGVRGSPGNTVCHPVSYFVVRHSQRVFVEAVDMVCGVGTDRGAFEIRRVITDLGVFDFESEDGGMRARSLHPGVMPKAVENATGFQVQGLDGAPETRGPTDAESALLDRLDPGAACRGLLS
jgi:acyl CoA:acetate/3-ketoacid CoA transferase beta subunit